MDTKQSRNVAQLYPEVAAGGFSHVDGTLEFYARINALIEPHFTVLDLGAGRGAKLERGEQSFRRKLSQLQGKVAKLVGVDVDDAVFENRFLDEAKLIKIGEPYPFPDNTFDLIFSDWVLEHIDNPVEFAAEVTRVLKPGGWFCARTPNRWGMIALVSSLIPNNSHASLVAKLQADRESKDVFPTRYRLNTLRQVKEAFPPEHWQHCSYLHNPEPPYVQRSIWAMRAVRFAWRFAPRYCFTVLNVFVRQKPSV